MNKFLGSCALAFFVFSTSMGTNACDQPGACISSTLEAANPFDTKPFVIPEEFADDWSSYRNSWARLTGFELSGLHWNQFVIVYANKGRAIYKQNFAEYIRFYVEEDDEEDAEFAEYEVGTVFVKENYIAHQGSVGDPLSLTTMIKHKPGYDPDHGDWEYIQSDSKGNIILRGKASDALVNKVCADCHSSMDERDYIFATYYSEPQ